MAAFDASHARRDRSQYENAFKPFAEDENTDVEECNRLARIGPHRIGRAMRRDSLPDQHRDHEKSGGNDADAQCGFHLP